MKNEVRGQVAKCKSYEAVRLVIEDLMDYYNADRCRWSLMKLSPKELYDFTVIGIYPLPPYTKH